MCLLCSRESPYPIKTYTNYSGIFPNTSTVNQSIYKMLSKSIMKEYHYSVLHING